MAQRLVTSFINTNIPGAYPNITVQSQPVILGQSGIVAIFGEATGGASYESTVLKNNVFTPAQLQQVQQKYVSGPIVDAFTALAAPSNDADITGSANQIYIIKTNTGTAASAALAGGYGTIEDQNFGIPGNNYQYQITNTALEAGPSVTGTTISSYTGLSGASFSVRLDGGAATLITPMGTITNVATLVSSLNAAFSAASLPSIVASAGVAANTIELSLATDAGANSRGYGKSLELIDSSPGDLAALGLSAQLLVSSQEPSVEIKIINSSTGLNETLDANAAVALTVGYAGLTGTLTINGTTLSTTVVGGSGANLSIPLAQFTTIGALASYISTQTGYSATAIPAASSLPPSALDEVSALGIAATGASDQPGRIKNAAYAFQQALSTSTALQFIPLVFAGLPAAMAAPVFLTGGTRGATLAADIVNALAQLGGVNVNIIVPLFSQNASLDIAAGLTDPSSTYTIAAINAGTKNHCIEFSTPSLKKNRICILSQLDTYANAAAEAQSLANYRCSLAIQSPTQVNSQGIITSFQPWYNAVVAAGMQAGGFYKSICNKYANVISFADPVGFDSGNPGDVEDALSAGLLILTQDTAGNRWVSDQTTYGYDTNFVYNSIQAVYCSDILALDLASSFQSAFVGKSLADVDATTALSYLAQKMDGYKKIKLIAASDDAPLGYKNQSVSILGPTMTVAVEIKLATAIYFVPISINISEVQSSAS